MLMKNVILLGDSIRLYYQDRVKELLGNNFEVFYPVENCKFSGFTLNSLRFWLPTFPKPDIIHFNNGLWDVGINYDEDGNFTPLEDYLNNLRKIVRELKKTGAKLIFSTTTPTRKEKEKRSLINNSIHKVSDIRRYNEAAILLMKELNVEINDLFSVVDGHIEEFIRDDDLIHPTDKGIEALAKAVVKAIKKEL